MFYSREEAHVKGERGFVSVKGKLGTKVLSSGTRLSLDNTRTYTISGDAMIPMIIHSDGGDETKVYYDCNIFLKHIVPYMVNGEYNGLLVPVAQSTSSNIAILIPSECEIELSKPEKKQISRITKNMVVDGKTYAVFDENKRIVFIIHKDILFSSYKHYSYSNTKLNMSYIGRDISRNQKFSNQKYIQMAYYGERPVTKEDAFTKTFTRCEIVEVNEQKLLDQFDGLRETINEAKRNGKI